MAYQGVDNFEYWMKLTVRGTDRRRVTAIVRKIEKQLGVFTGRLTEEDMGFRCTSYHIFPFDTRTIATVIGNHPRSQYSFSISLEDININPGEGSIIIPTVRVYRWKGTCDDPNRDEFSEIMRKELQALIKPYELIEVLRGIYNEIAQRHGLPLLDRPH